MVVIPIDSNFETVDVLQCLGIVSTKPIDPVFIQFSDDLLMVKHIIPNEVNENLKEYIDERVKEIVAETIEKLPTRRQIDGKSDNQSLEMLKKTNPYIPYHNLEV